MGTAAIPGMGPLTAALCGAVVTLGCSGAGGHAAMPDGGDAGGVSFVNDVYPIVAASCAVSGCHDMGSTTNHSTDYTTADKTYTRWVNGPGFDFCIDATTVGIDASAYRRARRSGRELPGHEDCAADGRALPGSDAPPPHAARPARAAATVSDRHDRSVDYEGALQN